MSDRPSSHFEDVFDILSDYMAQGVTGCLSIEDLKGRTFRVYLMQGEILAAHGPGDGLSLIRRLVNAGQLGTDRGTELSRTLRGGGRFDEILQGEVAEDVLVEALAGRFRQNLLDFGFANGGTIFEPMDAVFVDNIQVSHDSRELIARTIDLARRVLALAERAEELTLAPGPVMAQDGVEARIATLCREGMKLDRVLARSPIEPGQTLDIVRTMLEAGALVTEEAFSTSSPPESAQDDASTLPRTRGRPKTETPPAPEPARPQSAEEQLDSALRRAEAIEAQRALGPDMEVTNDDDSGDGVVKRPADHDVFGGAGELVEESELAMFDDYDQSRGMGQGDFSAERQSLDVVDLRDVLDPDAGHPAQEGSESHEIIEMGSLEDAPPEVAAAAVALNFAGPRLDEADVRNKIAVTNDVLAEVSRALDACKGHGAGRVAIQLLLDGAPNQYSVLFQGVEADPDGRIDTTVVMRNLQRRPPAEHRRLVGMGLVDLIERGLSSSLEELDEPQIDQMLERIAGYQQRMGL